MTKSLATLGAVLLLAVLARECMAALPSDYDAVRFDEAVTRAQQDGRPIMVYFGEDW